jgi:hypothetical protein
VIQLQLPGVNERYWFSDSGFIFGPYQMTKPSTEPVGTLFRPKSDFLVEERGIYGENVAFNSQFNGVVTYSPIISEFVPSPTTGAPNRIVWSCYRSGNPGNYVFPGGIGMVNAYLRQDTYTHSLVISNDKYDVNVLMVKANFGNFFRAQSVEVVRLQYQSMTGWQMTCRQEIYQYLHYVNNANTPFSLAGADLTPDQMRSMMVGTPLLVSSGNFGKEGHRSDSSYVIDPVKIQETADALVSALHVDGGITPLEDVHYGDLAMKATEKVNANGVNMIAFLKDLRRPQELIPKLLKLDTLRNGRALGKKLGKNFSDNYLTAVYGVLPTIADLKEIHGSLSKMRRTEKNGFKTYSSSVTNATAAANKAYVVEQRIKVAIDNEDSAFDAIVNMLDNIGLFPDCENLWDLVPYSFVVDWFVDIGSFLERIDSGNRIARLNIRYATMSRKSQITTHLKANALSPFTGTVTQVHYHRWVSDQCPVPPASVRPTFQFFNHWLEGGALLMQRR